MDKLNYIIFIQLRFKFLYKLKKKKNNLYNDIYTNIKKLMNRNEESFQLDIINNYTYNTVNNELYTIIENYNLQTLTFLKLKKIKETLKNISFKIGLKEFNDIYFYFDINNNKYESISNELEFINKFFNPTNIVMNNSNNTISEYDLSIISNLDVISYSKIKKKNISLFEHINGCIIYLKCNDKILIITGYFIKDSLNLIRQSYLLKTKYNNLIEKIDFLVLNKSFKYNYLEQLSLCDIFIYDNDTIIDNIKNDYLKINNYKKNTISYIVKDFLNKNIKEQLELIVLCLLIDNNELEHISYLLYDLINNDSYLLKSQLLSEKIFNNLHWSLQKKFKTSASKIEDKIKNKNFKIEEVSYEKRIYLMKCDDYIKEKALEKYKEIINKSNENSYKSQQYLDSLLKVPFNIYKKEKILYLKDLYENKIINIITQVNKYINENKINYPTINNFNNFLYIDMVDSINKLKKFNNLNNNTIDKYIKINKNKEIKNVIDMINNDQSIIKYKNKCNKKEYFNILNSFFNNKDINESLKSKYYSIININSNPLNNTINNIITEWDEFKLSRKVYINNLETILNNAIYSQYKAKLEIKRIIGQWINGKMTGYCLGFEGPPGIGKTSLAKKGISKCLLDDNGVSRPFYFLALGGSSNGSFLEGHNYTYVGSTYGKIIEILIQTQCMNPIIYIDELDKISNTENGKEIIGILTHLTDSSQNEQFNDKYFSGINIDLSKILFIFSYNDFSKLDPILADRIHRIKFSYLQKYEKIHIMKHYIIPELLENIGYKTENIMFDDSIIEYIISNYTCEAGVRKLKEKTYEIIREINLNEIMTNSNDTKITITLDYVKNLFANKPQLSIKKAGNTNVIGVVNGLYATSMGLGGIIPIQVTHSFNNTKMNVTITGQQGDVMKESIYCAKTIAWNIIPNSYKKDILKIKNIGLHLHCPEASTPKDGPSAGGAITLAFVSIFTNIKVIQSLGLTGEIDLKGCITKIGGLDLKIQGGKDAGLKTILVPYENKEDYDIIKIENPSILENITIIFVKTINEIIKYGLEDNSIEFNL